VVRAEFLAAADVVLEQAKGDWPSLAIAGGEGLSNFQHYSTMVADGL
jgi:hypothetical protein